MEAYKEYNDILQRYEAVFKKVMEQIKDSEEIIYLAIGDIAYNAWDLSKSILTLAKSSQYAGISSMSRLIFERYVYIVYILETDSKRRAEAYRLSSFVEQKKVTNIMLNSKEIKNIAEVDSSINDSLERFKQLKSQYDSFQQDYDSLYPHKLKKWYDYDEKTGNFAQLCGRLGLMAEYDTLFRFLSFEVHAKNGLRHFHYDEENEETRLLPTRFNEKQVEKMVIPTLKRILRELIKYFDIKEDD